MRESAETCLAKARTFRWTTPQGRARRVASSESATAAKVSLCEHIGSVKEPAGLHTFSVGAVRMSATQDEMRSAKYVSDCALVWALLEHPIEQSDLPLCSAMLALCAPRTGRVVQVAFIERPRRRRECCRPITCAYGNCYSPQCFTHRGSSNLNTRPTLKLPGRSCGLACIRGIPSALQRSCAFCRAGSDSD